MTRLIVCIFLAVFSVQSSCDPAVMQQVFDTVVTETVTEADVANGLKEALVQGATNGSAALSAVDGYLGNALVKILFPPEAQKVEKTLRDLGMGKLCDDVITSVNRAAEAAAVEAKAILINSARQMTVTDAMDILFGANDAATEYFKKTSTTQLIEKFTPVIDKSLKSVNATKYWSDAISYYNQIPLVEDMNPDLTGYVTQKALDGLFYTIEQEELKIRNNINSRESEIVKKVFAYYDANK